jgi:peptidoglycan/LPS O-acetylase OafA/YrhL
MPDGELAVLALLGDASYSIYLFHPLVFYFVYIKLQPPLPPLWMQEPLRYGALVAICALAIVSWKFFERPMIQVGDRVARFLRDGSSPVLVDQTAD